MVCVSDADEAIYPLEANRLLLQWHLKGEMAEHSGGSRCESLSIVFSLPHSAA